MRNTLWGSQWNTEWITHLCGTFFVNRIYDNNGSLTACFFQITKNLVKFLRIFSIGIENNCLSKPYYLSSNQSIEKIGKFNWFEGCTNYWWKNKNVKAEIKISTSIEDRVSKFTPQLINRSGVKKTGKKLARYPHQIVPPPDAIHTFFQREREREKKCTKIVWE